MELSLRAQAELPPDRGRDVRGPVLSFGHSPCSSSPPATAASCDRLAPAFTSSDRGSAPSPSTPPIRKLLLATAITSANEKPPARFKLIPALEGCLRGDGSTFIFRVF